MASEPTATVGLRNDFRTELTVRFRALKSALRETVGYANDALELRQSGDSGQLFAAAGDIEPASGFPFTTTAEAQDEFLGWLDEQIERGILEPIDRQRIRDGEHYTARYVRSASRRGVTHADSELNKHGVEVPEQQLEQAFNRAIPEEDLQRLYTRAFDNLETVTQEMRTNVRRELSTAFSQGHNPRKAARAMNERVDNIGIVNAERLARTEILNAHNTAAESRYSQFGVSEVDVLGSNPCSKICAPIIANNPYPLDDLPHGGPPFHPNCVGSTAPRI